MSFLIKLSKLHWSSAVTRRGIYLLPNLFTTGCLFAGFYAIVQAMNGDCKQGALAVLVAMILDGLDGRVARFTKTQTTFGAEYDSLSDMVSFGAAPALIVYQWVMRDMSQFGWITSFLYCLGAALRLARFNATREICDMHYFQGLPSPAAAALVVGFIWMASDLGIYGINVSWIASGIAAFAGISMITNVKFYSFKNINFRKKIPFLVTILPTLLLVLSYPIFWLFSIFLIYALSGYVMKITQRFSKTDSSKIIR